MVQEIQESFLLQFFYFVVASGGLFYLVLSISERKIEFNKRLFLFSLIFGLTMWFVFSMFVFDN